MNAPNLSRLCPHQRARRLAIEASGISVPGMRLFVETLDFPQACRMRACRRAKACIGAKLYCMTANRELLLNEVLPAVMESGADHQRFSSPGRGRRTTRAITPS
jgi:hypothetical protein